MHSWLGFALNIALDAATADVNCLICTIKFAKKLDPALYFARFGTVFVESPAIANVRILHSPMACGLFAQLISLPIRFTLRGVPRTEFSPFSFSLGRRCAAGLGAELCGTSGVVAAPRFLPSCMLRSWFQPPKVSYVCIRRMHKRRRFHVRRGLGRWLWTTSPRRKCPAAKSKE